jgi:hypothetical protein
MEQRIQAIYAVLSLDKVVRKVMFVSRFVYS